MMVRVAATIFLLGLLRKGQVYVEEWMQRNCSLILVDESYQGAVAGFLRFREQFRGRTGQE